VNDPKLQELFEAYRPSIEAMRTGLEVGNARLPTPRGSEDEPVYLSKFRDLVWVMAMEGRTQAAAGDYAGAIDTYVTALDFANESQRGGFVMNSGVSYAIGALAMDALTESFGAPGMTAEDYQSVIAQLQRLDSQAVPIGEQFATEAMATATSLNGILENLPEIRQLAQEDAGAEGSTDAISQMTDAQIVEYIEGLKDDYARASHYCNLSPHDALSADPGPPYEPTNPMSDPVSAVFSIQATAARDRARFRGAEVMAALELYRTQNGAYPATLDALAPEYLSRVPMDPFSEQPFIYTPAESG